MDTPSPASFLEVGLRGCFLFVVVGAGCLFFLSRLCRTFSFSGNARWSVEWEGFEPQPPRDRAVVEGVVHQPPLGQSRNQRRRRHQQRGQPVIERLRTAIGEVDTDEPGPE